MIEMGVQQHTSSGQAQNHGESWRIMASLLYVCNIHQHHPDLCLVP